MHVEGFNIYDVHVLCNLSTSQVQLECYTRMCLDVIDIGHQAILFAKNKPGCYTQNFFLFFFLCQHAKGGRVSYYCVATAPSIPMPGQNCGYEEDKEQGLKPQILPSRYTIMGPAYYDVTHVQVFV